MVLARSHSQANQCQHYCQVNNQYYDFDSVTGYWSNVCGSRGTIWHLLSRLHSVAFIWPPWLKAYVPKNIYNDWYSFGIYFILIHSLTFALTQSMIKDWERSIVCVLCFYVFSVQTLQKPFNRETVGNIHILSHFSITIVESFGTYWVREQFDVQRKGNNWLTAKTLTNHRQRYKSEQITKRRK